MPDHAPALVALQSRLGHPFRDPELLRCAITHPSYLAEHPEAKENNQRLEFLGDSVIQILLAEKLFHLFPEDREGRLNKRRALLVNGVFLAQLAREIGLAPCLRLSVSEETNGGRDRELTLGDAFEAVVAAVYLDSDLSTARRVVLSIYGDLAARLAPIEDADNPKGRLQELVQPKHGNNALHYEVVRVGGTAHAREFEVELRLNGVRLAAGCGGSKKLAEEVAARFALESWPPG